MSRDDWGLALQDLEEAHRKNQELVRIFKSIPGETATGEWLPADRDNAYESALESAMRPTPIPTDAAATLNRCAEPIDYLRHHAHPDYLRTGTPPPSMEEVFGRIESRRSGRASSQDVVAALEAERARR